MTAPDTERSVVIRDHPFEPKDPSQPWGLCKRCNLAESTHVSTTGSYIPTSPPAGPPAIPPGGRPVDRQEPPEDDQPTPFPVPEISLEEGQEFRVKQEELVCWKCGAKDKVRRLPENGAVLCPGCIETLKP